MPTSCPLPAPLFSSAYIVPSYVPCGAWCVRVSGKGKGWRAYKAVLCRRTRESILKQNKPELRGGDICRWGGSRGGIGLRRRVTAPTHVRRTACNVTSPKLPVFGCWPFFLLLCTAQNKIHAFVVVDDHVFNGHADTAMRRSGCQTPTRPEADGRMTRAMKSCHSPSRSSAVLGRSSDLPNHFHDCFAMTSFSQIFTTLPYYSSSKVSCPQ